MPQRILILGGQGSGKSTLARRLAEVLGLPATDLDEFYWSNWRGRSPTREEIREAASRLASPDAWIVAGNHARVRDIFLAACEAVILLELPRWLCIARILRRRLVLLGRPGAERAPYERLTSALLRAAWTAPARWAPLLHEVGRLGPAKKVIRLRSRSQVRQLLRTCRSRGREAIGVSCGANAHAR